MRRSFYFLMMISLLTVSVLAGCGDDGDDNGGTATPTTGPGATATPMPTATPTIPAGGTSLSGIAATGAPIDGDVCVLDGNGDEVDCVEIAADGGFMVPTTGTAGPYLLAAFPGDGSDAQYSWSPNGNGLVNINPFTTLSLLLATDYADLDAYYADWAQALSEVDGSVLADAVDAVLDYFANDLAGVVSGDFDPFFSAFAADGTGFDGVLDGLSFDFDYGTGIVNLDGTGLVINFDPNGTGGGNYRLTISVSVSGAPATQVATIDNIAKPNAQGEFCAPEIYDDYFSSVGTYTVTSCSFDGTVGRISANISVAGFNIAYTATYTYSAL